MDGGDVSRQNGLRLARPFATRRINIAEGSHTDRLTPSVLPAENVIGMTGKATDGRCCGVRPELTAYYPAPVRPVRPISIATAPRTCGARELSLSLSLSLR